jgi:hypothetical protein
MMQAQAQYWMWPNTTAAENPNGINNDVEQPAQAGWTSIQTTSATPVWTANQTLPFAFNFNGAPVTQFKVSTSGVLTFDVATALAAPPVVSSNLPNAAVPDKSVCIRGLQGTGANDAIVTKTFGTAPNRQFWVQFNSYSIASNAAAWSYWSIVLEETSNAIYIVDHRTGSAAGAVSCALALGVQISSTQAFNALGSPFINTNTQDADVASDNAFYGFFPGTQPSYDLQARSITTKSYVAAGNNTITGTIRNNGSQTITSMTMNYQINGGAAVASPLTGLSIPPFQTYTFSHPTPWNGTLGTYTVSAYATNLNGTNMDQNTVNDKVNKTIVVLSKNVKRVPLLEVFTSSTCPPCKPGNEVLHGVIDPIPAADKPCTIKFQQDFPGTGDPYCTTEAVNRRNYYAVNSIPRMEIDGAWDKNAASFTSAILADAQASPAQYELSGSYWISGKTVHGKVNYAPAYNAPAGTKLYVAIIENKTIKNVKSNGETQFEQVMKKMLPSETGTTLPAQANGVSVTTNFDYTFQGNYRLSADGAAANRIVHTTENSVEEFTDLAMVAWLQGADKTVYQALNLTATPTGVGNFSANINAVNVYPNPSNTEVNIAFTSAKTENTTILMMSTDGKIVYSSKKDMQTGDNKVTINTADLANGIYNIAIIDAANNSKTMQVVVAH